MIQLGNQHPDLHTFLVSLTNPFDAAASNLPEEEKLKSHHYQLYGMFRFQLSYQSEHDFLKQEECLAATS